MNSAVVIAAKQFTGFEICKGLLNEGYHVIAFEHSNRSSRREEEKWMEIGRNANLTFVSSPSISFSTGEKLMCFVPLYDYQHPQDEPLDERYTEEILGILSSAKDNNASFVIVLPAQLLRENKAGYTAVYSLLEQCLETIKGSRCQLVYMPTLFGPWQPEDYLFQQLINEQRKDRLLDDQTDAMYIEDGVQALIHQLNEAVWQDSILLKSQEENNWMKCLQHLDREWKESLITEERVLDGVKIVKVPATLAPEDVFLKQRQCLNYFYK